MNEENVVVEQEIDLRQYLRVIWKWRWLITLITVIAILTAGVFSFLIMAPVYEARATLLVTHGSQEQRIVTTDGTESVVNAVSRLPIMSMNSYVGQLKSPYFLNRVIRAAKLDPNEYTPEKLLSALTITTMKDTNLIEVKFENTNPELAASVLNTLCKEFLAFVSENIEEQMAKSVRFLEQQEAVVSKDLEAARQKLRNWTATNNTLELLQRRVQSLNDEIARQRSQLLRAQVERGLLDAGFARLREELSRTPPTLEGNPNPAYEELQKTLLQKEVALTEKEAEIKLISGFIDQLNKDLEVAQSELAAKQDEYRAVEKEVSELENTLSLIKQKRIQTQMATSVNMGETNISLVSPALVPAKPVKPRKALNMAVAGVLGLMVSVMLAFVLEYMDDTIKTADDVSRVLGLPTLGSIPVFGKH
ncbi:MAG: GumC family protein [Bacillota bacterium]